LPCRRQVSYHAACETLMEYAAEGEGPLAGRDVHGWATDGDLGLPPSLVDTFISQMLANRALVIVQVTGPPASGSASASSSSASASPAALAPLTRVDAPAEVTVACDPFAAAGGRDPPRHVRRHGPRATITEFLGSKERAVAPPPPPPHGSMQLSSAGAQLAALAGHQHGPGSQGYPPRAAQPYPSSAAALTPQDHARSGEHQPPPMVRDHAHFSGHQPPPMVQPSPHPFGEAGYAHAGGYGRSQEAHLPQGLAQVHV
jgi:hypothetical protein